MDATEFDEKLIAIDRLLMEKQVPISSRLILAYFHLTGARQLRLSEKVAVHQCRCGDFTVMCARAGTLVDGPPSTLQAATSGCHPRRAG
jgi:hypothetical protein